MLCHTFHKRYHTHSLSHKTTQWVNHNHSSIHNSQQMLCMKNRPLGRYSKNESTHHPLLLLLSSSLFSPFPSPFDSLSSSSFYALFWYTIHTTYLRLECMCILLVSPCSNPYILYALLHHNSILKNTATKLDNSF